MIRAPILRSATSSCVRAARQVILIISDIAIGLAILCGCCGAFAGLIAGGAFVSYIADMFRGGGRRSPVSTDGTRTLLSSCPSLLLAAVSPTKCRATVLPPLHVFFAVKISLSTPDTGSGRI